MNNNKRHSHLRQPSSSLPSLQSNIPSHLYVSCMHCLRSAHLNCVGEHVIGGQPSSSWLSKQSLSPSHTHVCGIQWPDRGQVNWKRAKIFHQLLLFGEDRQRSRPVGRRYTTYLEIGTRLFRAKVAFVRTVTAVVFGVTFPRSRYAPAIFAQELGRRTRNVRAPGFVAVIAAVVFTVAPERARYATARTALPFARGAGRFWKTIIT